MLLQGNPEPTCHPFQRLVSLPLPNPDILERPARVPGTVPQEQGSAPPGPAALPASPALSPDIPALHLLAVCAEVGSLQFVTVCLHGRPLRKRLPMGSEPFLLHPQQSHCKCCCVGCVPVCIPFLQGVQQQEQLAKMAADSQAAETVSGGKAPCATFPAAKACLVNVFGCLDPALESSMERPSLLLQGSSSKAVDSEATASGDGVKVSSIVSVSACACPR